MDRHVTPFLRSINTSLFSGSLRDWVNDFIMYFQVLLLAHTN